MIEWPAAQLGVPPEFSSTSCIRTVAASSDLESIAALSPPDHKADVQSAALWPFATGPDADAYITARLYAPAVNAAGLKGPGKARSKDLSTPPGFSSQSTTTSVQQATQLRSKWTVTGRPDSTAKGTCRSTSCTSLLYSIELQHVVSTIVLFTPPSKWTL